MKKKKETHVVKEVFIFIILLILIMLILAVALYDFIPSNISVPETIEYTSDSQTTSVKQEIAYTNEGDTSGSGFSEQELVTSLKSYSIEAADLAVYSEKNLFNRGNSNPFDDVPEETAQPAETTPAQSATSETTGNTTSATNTTANTETNTTSQAATTRNN